MEHFLAKESVLMRILVSFGEIFDQNEFGNSVTEVQTVETEDDLGAV